MSFWPAPVANHARPGTVLAQRVPPAAAQHEPRLVAADGKPAAVVKAGGQPPSAEVLDDTRPGAVLLQRVPSAVAQREPRLVPVDGKPAAVVRAGG
jgi:hypothetical protein